MTLRHLLTDPITDDHEGVRAALEGANVLALAATGDAVILRRPIRPHWAMTAAPDPEAHAVSETHAARSVW